MSNIVSLTEAASIALHGMIIVARADEKANVMQISDMMKSSRHHVAKIFQRLVKDGFLDSYRGPSGGFSLKRKAEEITLLEIYESIEGKIDVNRCPHERQICPFEKCILDNITQKMTSDFREFLHTHTIADYL
ncbi:MAG: Rrf2 family transcriptional regulator [Bacteroidales bacterium]|jgi:Rrf2 family protein|nr:Rrf2 family transcriptional regulator [Bacteroidales bacterium]MCK9448596.1 Rrf2 family transcriptional regulator [Bacteroidales bacterium]MDD3700990.1 Rrf2 family transcriptional regulator [Bacteroidales bacterium]MDY0369117.1 Rrf2 family transcriptional regulator [Bacteroidales bacterium]